MARTPLKLPDFPWDSLAPFAERARAHPDGFIAAAATALAGDRLQNAANAKAGLQRAATTLVDLESFKAVQQRLTA